MRKSSIPLSAFSTCDRTREIWRQLNELRGVCAISWIECDMKSLSQRFENLRDDLGMHYAHEWGGTGQLRQASLHRSVSREQLSQFLREQTQIYEMVSELATDVAAWVSGYEITPKSIRAAKARFKVIDTLLIAHETRKSNMLHRG